MAAELDQRRLLGSIVTADRLIGAAEWANLIAFPEGNRGETVMRVAAHVLLITTAPAAHREAMLKPLIGELTQNDPAKATYAGEYMKIPFRLSLGLSYQPYH